MIQKLEINGIHATVDRKLHDYVIKKIGKLDRYMSRHARESVHVEVKLKEEKRQNKKQCVCEVIMYLPHGTLMTKESTLNMFAAVDIVEAKLKNQIKSYKEKHTHTRFHRRVLARLRGKSR